MYGPHMPKDTPYAGVASLFRSALERGEAPRVYEDGGQRRDFVHVRDVARANLAALSGGGPGELAPYNIASGVPHTVGDLAGNADIVSRWTAQAVEQGCHLVAFPEMILTGYPAEDLVLRSSFVQASMDGLEALATRLADEGAGEDKVRPVAAKAIDTSGLSLVASDIPKEPKLTALQREFGG